MAFPATPTLGQQVENPAGSGNWWVCVDIGPPPRWDRLPEAPAAGDRYENTYAGAIWTVGHSLNQRLVSVQTVDSAGNLIIGDPDYTSVNVVTLTFSESVSGTAVIRR